MPARRARRPSPRRAAGTPTRGPSDARAANKQRPAPRRPRRPARPRTWAASPPRAHPRPPRPPGRSHLPEVGGRGAQRGEQQRQGEGRGQPARQQGPIQHLAAPRRLTIALPARAGRPAAAALL